MQRRQRLVTSGTHRFSSLYQYFRYSQGSQWSEVVSLQMLQNILEAEIINTSIRDAKEGK